MAKKFITLYGGNRLLCKLEQNMDGVYLKVYGASGDAFYGANHVLQLSKDGVKLHTGLNDLIGLPLDKHGAIKQIK